MTPASSGLFLIVAGVRRAVAAREVGLTTFPALIAAGPRKGQIIDVLLDELYATKDRVSRSAQNWRYDDIERAVADPLVRPKVPELEISPVSAKRAARFTKLTDVVLEP
jgi:hypothetical protein